MVVATTVLFAVRKNAARSFEFVGLVSFSPVTICELFISFVFCRLTRWKNLRIERGRLGQPDFSYGSR